MPHLLAAPDKFRGTASAVAVAAAAASSARLAGWSADESPMSDGGEGFLEVVGGASRFTVVPGPLGAPVSAEWRLLPSTPERGPTAVIEMSRVAGRALLPHPSGDEPMVADTAGVGHLVLSARDAGATRIVIGCGGSATTDGGWGAVGVIGSSRALAGIDLEVACDVSTVFGRAAEVFGRQKGASPVQIEALTARLDALAERYRRSFGVDVATIAGSGAAGGLAGGLAALGARLGPGFDIVATMTGLARRIAACDLVITGEGHLDPPSFDGKVPGGVLALARDHCPVLCVVGDAEPELLRTPPAGMQIVSLSRRYGPVRARVETTTLVGAVVSEALAGYRR